MQEHPDLLMTTDNDPREAIKKLTRDIEEQIRGGTLDAPSWEILRIGIHLSRESLYSACCATTLCASRDRIDSGRVRPIKPTLR
jgi:hypothetical protein